MRQTGDEVWDVKLPAWAHDDPRLFTLIHRQVLESDYVTANLASWIDLVFGFKQTGKAAIDAINVFHPAVSFCLIPITLNSYLGNIKIYFNFLSSLVTVVVQVVEILPSTQSIPLPLMTCQNKEPKCKRP